MLASTRASASAPAVMRSALKTGCSASKRVSWDPSVAGNLPQVKTFLRRICVYTEDCLRVWMPALDEAGCVLDKLRRLHAAAACAVMGMAMLLAEGCSYI